MSTQKDTIDFGFETIATEQKAGKVRAVFDSVASNYDIMNDAMSMGIHRLWKKTLLDRLSPRPGQSLIDVAGGTGDIAAGFIRRANERGSDKPAHATICDINHSMLKAGQERGQNVKNPDAPYQDQMTRVCGNAEALPLPSSSMNAYTIGFGIRNVTDRDAALHEAYRVLKPGGRFICLEFSHMITGSLQKLYDTYSFNAIPWLGEKIADDRDSYQYLIESIRKFPTQEAFRTQIEHAGFSKVRFENLSGGIAALHLAWRL